MTAVPKCTSWLGHKFEARYSTVPPKPEFLNHFAGDDNYVWAVLKAVEQFTTKTYEGDVCVRCGALVLK